MTKRGWKHMECGCCAGLEWGGEYPRECKLCGGSGSLYIHVKSGVLAQYPGGPLAGRVTTGAGRAAPRPKVMVRRCS